MKLKNKIIKFLVLNIIFIITYLLCIYNYNVKNFIYLKVYNSNISFTTIKKNYSKIIKNIIPYKKMIQEKKVFNENLSYLNKSKYNNGLRLKLSDDYLVPSIKKGIVIFDGVKDNKRTLIIESDNVDIYYINLENVNVKLYDYVEKGEVLGTAKNNTLYLLFKKDGVEVDYKKYIK